MSALSRQRRCSRLAAVTAAALAAAAAGMLSAGPARANPTQESIFQDDNHLVYAPTATVDHVLGVLQSLGVDRVRVTVLWKAIAPDPGSSSRPAGFDATNPAAYPADRWAPYDRVLELAAAHGIGVDFNLTAPGPLWAMRPNPPTARSADHYAPSVKEYGDFVTAAGTRFSGRYVPAAQAGAGAIPRVQFWTIWNEPNIPGWLAPQWRGYRGRKVPNSPRLYRQYVDVGFGALAATGHGVSTDTILVGELAPEGYTTPGFYTPMRPLPFLRGLYCVDGSYRQLTGAPATALGCPAHSSRAAFAANHPGLFHATGFAHHPYYFFFAPDHSALDVNFVPIANLSRLEGGLDRIFRLYGVARRIPIYLTEYGYQTYPDPFYGPVVSFSQQAAYLNQADYMAYRDPRVRSVAQFLLYDDGPDTRYSPTSFNYWDTFQTGLLFASGARKPAFAAYRLPIWIPRRRISRGGSTVLWGQLRATPDGTAQRALIQWRPPGGSYRTIVTLTVPASHHEGYFTARVRPPRSGTLRIAASSQTSRDVSVRVF